MLDFRVRCSEPSPCYLLLTLVGAYLRTYLRSRYIHALLDHYRSQLERRETRPRGEPTSSGSVCPALHLLCPADPLSFFPPGDMWLATPLTSYFSKGPR